MEDIIKKAIEGGYLNIFLPAVKAGRIEKYRSMYRQEGGYHWLDIKGGYNYRFEEIVCDPLFWQSLGKACGWAKDNAPYLCKDCGVIGVGTSNHMNACPTKRRHYSWKEYALRFHEINLTEGWDKAVAYLSDITKAQHE